MTIDTTNMAGLKVAWLVPFIEKGSGGLQTVFRHVSYLQKLGAECHVIGCFQEASDCSQFMAEILRESYQCEPDKIIDTGTSDEEYDVAVATLNTTVPFLLKIKARRRAYFVQDYEPYFGAVGYQYLMAENTYRRNDLSIITIGRWLVHKLFDMHGIYAKHTEFSADQSVYHPLNKEKRRAVCAIVQPDKDRRCPKLVADTFELIHLLDPEIELITYGSDKSYQFPIPVEAKGLLTKQGCNELYNECMVGLCISLTNPSRIPFEMMASGLPAVDVYRDNTLWDFSSDATTLAVPNPASLATAIVALIKDQNRLAAMSEAGLKFMEKRSGQVEQEGFAQAILEIIGDTKRNDLGIEKTYLAPPVVAPPEVQLLEDAITGERTLALLTPPALVSGSRYIQVEIDGVTPEEAQAGVDVWVKVLDRAVPKIECYKAFCQESGVFKAQVDRNDFFDGEPCLCHIFVLRKATDVDEELLLAKRSIRLTLNDSKQFANNGFVFDSAGVNGHVLKFSFSDKPFVINAKTLAKYLLKPEKVEQLKQAVARFR